MSVDEGKENKKFKLVGINGRYVHSCLPLFYMRNELERYQPDWDIEILQFTINDNYFETLLNLSAGDPDYIFLSAVIWNSELVEKLTTDLAVCLPACRVVIGGPQAGVLCRSLTTANFTAVTGAVEALGDSFYEALEAGCLAERYECNFFKMERRGYDFPYRQEDFSRHLSNRHIYYESSRGCIFSCSYCLSSVDKGVFHKPLDVVKAELSQILQNKPKIVRFIDRTFNDIPQRSLAIWEYCLDEGGDTLFHFEMAPDRFTEEMYEFLSRLGPGKFQFEIGIQSTHAKTLEAVNRPVDTSVVHAAVARLAALGNIHLHVDLILGLPFETRSTFAKSFADVFFMGADYIQMGLLKLLPDTPLRDSGTLYRYKYSQSPPYSVLENMWMDHRTITDLYWYSECVEKFMNNRYFVSLWRYLRRRREDIFTFFSDLLRLCEKENAFSYAPTQELLCSQLVKLFADRKDCELLMELLRVDWLRCGHRFLPDCLKRDEVDMQLQEAKEILSHRLPEEMDGLYTRGSRNKFFKKSCFLRISQNCLDEIGLMGKSSQPILCFLSEREKSLHSFNKVLVF